MSLIHRLVALILLAVLPVAGTEAYTQFILLEEREQDVEARAMRLARHVEVEYVRLIESMRHTLTTLAATDSITQAAPGHCQRQLDDLALRYPPHLKIKIADADGTILCSTDPAFVGRSIGDRAYFRDALRDRAFSVGAFGDQVDSAHPAVPFALPAFDAHGGATRVVVAAVSAGWLQEFLDQQPLPPSADAMIADVNGTVLAARSQGAVSVDYPLPAPYMQFLDEPAAGVGHVTGPRGRERVLAYLPVGVAARGLFTAIALDSEASLAPVREAAIRAVLVSTVVVLLAVMAAVWGAHVFLRRPIAALVEATRRWRAGDFATRSRVGGTTELAELGRAFDEMAAHLTEQERMREAAAAAERRMATVLASTTDGIVNIDRAWRFTYLNPRAAALLPGGERLLGREVFGALPELRGSVFERQCRTALETQEQAEFEAFFPPLQAWYSTRAFPSGDGLTLYFQDVTPRRRDEQALALAARQRSEVLAQLNALLENAPVGLIYMDREGRYVRVNAAMARTNGLSEDDHIGRHVRDVMPGLDAALIQEQIDRVFQERRAVADVEFSAVDPAEPGMRLHWLTNWFPVIVDNEVLFAGVVTQDITILRRIESDLRAAKDEAVAANRAKSRFLAAASHDLRQPLQSLFLFRAALERHVTDTAGRHKLDMLAVGLETLKGLLDGLLDVSRLESGAVEPTVSVFPIARLLEEIADSYRPVAEEKGLRFLTSIACDQAVRSDPTLLGRMIRNLVENAIRYTPSGFVSLECHGTDDGCMRIDVIDSGIGIPPEEAPLIFDEFHQVGNPERDRTRGLGLGLSIVRRLSDLLGHPVAVSSRPGHGSRFSVLVRRTEAEPLKAPLRPAAAPGAGRFAVLIDDDPLVLIGLEATLQEFGFDVLASDSTEDALTRLREDGRKPDVVVADYRLRGDEVGTNAVRRIRALFPQPVPGLILTGETGGDTREDAARNGLGILHKPVDPDQLGVALEQQMMAAE
ncbi:PAS domain-containing protein [Novispirillum sp. DQ9]|uniref:PAS domain-containing protein n=1 Tax=Novispirillum sp. DQ9 TaxID=3398612 RepID=UPI003C7A3584